jgi:hypothetical protein
LLAEFFVHDQPDNFLNEIVAFIAEYNKLGGKSKYWRYDV